MHFRRNRVKLDLAQHMGKYVKSDFIYGKSDCNSSYLELEILNNRGGVFIWLFQKI